MFLYSLLGTRLVYFSHWSSTDLC